MKNESENKGSYCNSTKYKTKKWPAILKFIMLVVSNFGKKRRGVGENVLALLASSESLCDMCILMAL